MLPSGLQPLPSSLCFCHRLQGNTLSSRLQTPTFCDKFIRLLGRAARQPAGTYIGWDLSQTPQGPACG
jgi:hypothetical protein